MVLTDSAPPVFHDKPYDFRISYLFPFLFCCLSCLTFYSFFLSIRNRWWLLIIPLYSSSCVSVNPTALVREPPVRYHTRAATGHPLFSTWGETREHPPGWAQRAQRSNRQVHQRSSPCHKPSGWQRQGFGFWRWMPSSHSRLASENDSRCI